MILEVVAIVFWILAVISAWPAVPVPPNAGFICLCISVLCIILGVFHIVAA